MKTLIINGSPKEKGDTTALIDEFKKFLMGDVKTISCTSNISPCIDCRYCWIVKNPDGSFYHSELYRNGECFLSVAEASKDKVDVSLVRLGYEFVSSEEVKRAYDLLKEGGRTDMPIGELPWSPCAASVVDRFGVWWYLSAASHRPPEDYNYWNDKHDFIRK